MFDRLIESRRKMTKGFPQNKKAEEEGGCGVVGFACSIPVKGKHIFEPSIQMHNRGNGKGGGIAAVGFIAEELGVSQDILEQDYILQIALLDPEVQTAVEEEFVTPYLKVDKAERIPTLADYRDIEGLEVKPPEVYRYFVRVKDDVLDRFIEKNSLQDLDRRAAEDEFIYQNSFKLNTRFYASLGEKKAFVLSHGRNILILKIVGFAEHIIKYYKMEDFKAHIWIAHQRYPTRGKVWHPGGAHPFIGLNEALVHNGDFANYHSVSEYLRQHGIFPLFLTDTEVAALLFDLLHRVYRYPLEYIIEAMAPTTELDFDRLQDEKQKIYRAIQTHHIHGSPDGPWFFIIARSNPMQLIGITDTSMLRPQVFAIYDGDVQIGLICSEKQAIDATLHSLSKEDSRFCPVADRYWNARGGSSTDGGAFIFNLKDGNLSTTDKFGRPLLIPKKKTPDLPLEIKEERIDISYQEIKEKIKMWSYSELKSCLISLKEIDILTKLLDLPFEVGDKKRSWILSLIRERLYSIFEAADTYIDWEKRSDLKECEDNNQTLIINGSGFPPEGEDSLARFIVSAYQLGWTRFILYNLCGQRFIGCGLGPKTTAVKIDVYGSSGDYLASGIDGLQIYVHGNAQDQVAQIMKRGKLVVYGDVGQTFMYGAKGGEAYILGNAAGRPLINACGGPRVVINGTCLDFLAESFMAGDPLNEGGFVILNGIEFDEQAKMIEQETPYPGSNLFSLASGGAIYIRDPHKKVVKEQLNGGEFSEFTDKDLQLILPYLEENERLFGISIDDLLKVDGVKRPPEEVYRKIRAIKLAVLTEVKDED